MWNSRNNKGFTLIEIVIAVGISGILLGAIGFFLMTGSRTYQIAKDATDIQAEAQVLVSQLKDRILECNYTEDYNTDGNHLFTLYSISEDTNKIEKKEVFWLDTSEGKLYYYELEGAAAAGMPTLGKEESRLFAEYVKELSVKRADTVVEVSVTLEKGSRSYQLKEEVKLRNKLVEKP